MASTFSLRQARPRGRDSAPETNRGRPWRSRPVEMTASQGREGRQRANLGLVVGRRGRWGTAQGRTAAQRVSQARRRYPPPPPTRALGARRSKTLPQVDGTARRSADHEQLEIRSRVREPPVGTQDPRVRRNWRPDLWCHRQSVANDPPGGDVGLKATRRGECRRLSRRLINATRGRPLWPIIRQDGRNIEVGVLDRLRAMRGPGKNNRDVVPRGSLSREAVARTKPTTGRLFKQRDERSPLALRHYPFVKSIALPGQHWWGFSIAVPASVLPDTRGSGQLDRCRQPP